MKNVTATYIKVTGISRDTYEGFARLCFLRSLDYHYLGGDPVDDFIVVHRNLKSLTDDIENAFSLDIDEDKKNEMLKYVTECAKEVELEVSMDYKVKIM